MTRRDTAWRAGHVLRGTRRQQLEEALVAERTALWQDFADLLDQYGAQAHAKPLVDRIRHMSVALGYPTPWTAVPQSCLYWYERTETCWVLGITAERPDYDEVASEPWEIPRESRWQLADPIDPFTEET